MKNLTFMIMTNLILFGLLIVAACGDSTVINRSPFGGSPTECEFAITDRGVALCAAEQHRQVPTQ